MMPVTAVDAAYKSDLREMNDLNFARFDAKLEQRFAEFRAENDRQLSELQSEVRALDSNLRLTLEKGLREQTRFFFLAWGVLLASIVALRFR